MVAGVALLDYDQDGYLDVFLVNGAEIPSLIKDVGRRTGIACSTTITMGRSPTSQRRAGVKGKWLWKWAWPSAIYDNDGYPDIFVANVTGNQLLHNNRDGTFTDVTESAGLGGAQYKGKKMWSTGAGWFDYNNDGRLDLFVVNYCVWSVNADPFCASPGMGRAYCHPRFYEPLHNTLYRKRRQRAFHPMSRKRQASRAVWDAG